MKVNFSTPALKLDGYPVLGEDGKPVLLGNILATKLVNLEGVVNYKLLYQLSKKLFNQREECEFFDDEIEIVKELLPTLPVLISGQIEELLDPKEEEKI